MCSARGLPDKASTLPTAVLTLGNQQGSTITGVTGPNPTWNEHFAFELKQVRMIEPASSRLTSTAHRCTNQRSVPRVVVCERSGVPSSTTAGQDPGVADTQTGGGGRRVTLRAR